MNKQAINGQPERRDMNHARCIASVETRNEGDDKQQVIVGYAAVFHREDDPGTEYRLWGDTVERIMPGAFDEALKDDDVRALVDHQGLLGRTASGTCRLSVDKVGLRYEIDVADTTDGRDTVVSLDRGDLDGSSFAFRTNGGKRGEVKWSEETRDGDTLYVREIHNLELLDVGPVKFPAYQATTSGLRSDSPELADLRDEFAAWRSSDETDFEEIDRMMDVDLAIAAAQLT